MTAKQFIEETRKWDKSKTGTFDYNGIISLLEEYGRKLEIKHMDEVKIRVHGEKLDPNKFEELARPMMKYLCEEFHPHVTVIITPTNAQLLEGLKFTGEIDDYVRD